jgi:hypothetical protein
MQDELSRARKLGCKRELAMTGCTDVRGTQPCQVVRN